MHALHQSCLAHLLRRAGELIADSIAGQAKIPHALRRLLLDALAVRDAHLDLLTRRDAHAGGEVIDGKHWGGNRTWHGADTQQVLMSVIRSARQQKLDPVALMRELLLAPAPTVASGLSIPQSPARADTTAPRSARSP